MSSSFTITSAITTTTSNDNNNNNPETTHNNNNKRNDGTNNPLLQILNEYYSTTSNSNQQSTLDQLLTRSICSFQFEEASKLLDDSTTKLQWTQPHYAFFFAIISSGPFPILKKMLDLGVNPNMTLENGETPLHVAANFVQNEEITRLLLERGANPNLRNINGKTARDIAIIINNKKFQHALDGFLSNNTSTSLLDEPIPQTCSYCGKISTTTITCNLCKLVNYCNSDCEKKHAIHHVIDCTKANGI
jgi:ankyrin repeat protein